MKLGTPIPEIDETAVRGQNVREWLQVITDSGQPRNVPLANLCSCGSTAAYGYKRRWLCVDCYLIDLRNA